MKVYVVLECCNSVTQEWCLQHDWNQFIDPRSGGFIRCSKCGMERDCEDPDGDLG